jgi:hypothetical protein
VGKLMARNMTLIFSSSGLTDGGGEHKEKKN